MYQKLSPEPFGFEPLSDDLHDLFVMDELLKSPQPFGFESFSDSRKTISSISAFPGHQSLSASSPCRTQIFKSVCQQIGAFMSPKPFGFEPFSDSKSTGAELSFTRSGSPQPFGFEPLSDFQISTTTSFFTFESRHSLSASSPFRTNTRLNVSTGIPDSRQSLSASSPCRTSYDSYSSFTDFKL